MRRPLLSGLLVDGQLPAGRINILTAASPNGNRDITSDQLRNEGVQGVLIRTVEAQSLNRVVHDEVDLCWEPFAPG